MPEPSLGYIFATIGLEKPSREFCGPNDTVKGTVTFKYRNTVEPKKGNDIPDEIFGPFRANVVLEGRLQARVLVDNTTIEKRAVAGFKEERLLFRNELCMHNGPLRLKRKESITLPFSTSFPDYADPRLLPGRDEDATARALEELPPTFSGNERGPGEFGGKAEVVYRIFVEAEMPGLDVGIRLRDGEHDLLYKPDGPPDPLDDEKGSLEQVFAVQKRDLCTDAERPNIFKAVLKREIDYPKFKFKLLCVDIPKHVRWGQAFGFRIQIQVDEESTVENVPEVLLKGREVSLRRATNVHAWSDRTQEQGDYYGRYIGYGRAPDLQCRTSPPGSFRSENGYSKSIEISPITGVLCTFRMENLAVSYQLRILIVLEVAGETLILSKSEPIVVHGPPRLGAISLQVETAPANDLAVQEELPAYTAEAA